MKLFIFLAAFIVMFAAQTNAQSYPFGNVQTTTSTADTITVPLTVTNQVTWLIIDSASLEATITVNATINSLIRSGALLYVKGTAKKGAGTTKVVNFGTGFRTQADSCTAQKTTLWEFIYTGTQYECITRRQLN